MEPYKPNFNFDISGEDNFERLTTNRVIDKEELARSVKNYLKEDSKSLSEERGEKIMEPYKPNFNFDISGEDIFGEDNFKRIITIADDEMDQFIFTTINEYCEQITKRVIDKEELARSVKNYFNPIEFIDRDTELVCTRCGCVMKKYALATEPKYCPICGKRRKL